MAVQPVPEGYSTVTPWIICKDTAGLTDYVQPAFGAEEPGRFETPDGAIGHVELRIGEAKVMGFDSPKGRPATPAFLQLYVAVDGSEAERRLRETRFTQALEYAMGSLVEAGPRLRADTAGA
ncbi:hypothetical protein V1460_35275 [Streptomyces sp. SCSIO 30461]|uniref:hypothetical protein n=1 Tax=Streptomyces sp. SCSIO 30461 TaxID=3118085 RepID=UPI0030CAE983